MADTSHASYLLPILTFCAGAVIAVPLFRWAGLSAVLGYLAAGVAMGPALLGLVRDPDTIRGIAEIGVVLLLFIVGLELRPSRLIAMRKDIFGVGTTQMLATGAFFSGLAYAGGLSPGGSVAVGISLALSATAVAMQILDERGDAAATYGRRTFSVLLFQDLAIAPILAAIPLLASRGATQTGEGLVALALAVGAIVSIVLAGRYALNPLFRLLARSGAREVMTAAALLVVLGAAVLMDTVGLSMAMGAFIAGVMLAESNFRHELEADIEPFRGVLLGLFFMAVGMSIDARIVLDNWLFLLLATAAVILVKIALAASLLRVSCSSWAESLRAGALLSPAGEFAFVLLPLALGLGLLTPAQAGLVTALAAMTMLAGPLVAKLLDAWLFRKDAATETIEEDFDGAGGSVMLIGFGRFGQMVTQALLSQNIDTTVIDNDVEQIRSAARFGIKVYFGDGTRLDVLRAAGAGRARVIAVAVDNREAALKITAMARSEFPNARLFVRAYDRIHAIALMEHEPELVIRETMESALAFGHATLVELGLGADEADTVIATLRKRDRTRLETQMREGVMAGVKPYKPVPVTPEPLTEPKAKPKALSQETESVLGPAGSSA